MMPQVVILCGGKATRLYPITKDIPKSMIEINGKPFINHQLKLLKLKGIKKVLICAGFLGDQIKEYVKDGKDFGLKVEYAFDGEKLLGTAGAIRKALNMLEDEFFIMYGDSYLDINYKDIYENYKVFEKDGLMVIIENHDRWDKSNVQFENNKLIKYDKINKDRKMLYIDYGLSIIKRNEIAALSENSITDLADVYKKMVNEGRMAAYVEKRRFYEIGSFKGLEETKEYISSR